MGRFTRPLSAGPAGWRLVDRVDARIQVPCEALSIQPPPHECSLWARRLRETWVVDVWSAEEDTEALVRWARQHGSFRARAGSSDLLVLETDQLPDAWEILLDHPLIQAVRLASDGSAVLEARGRRKRVENLFDVFGPAAEVKRVRVDTGAGVEEDPLTQTQREALLEAYEAGYFDVPRQVGLSDLADRMGKSSGWLSTLLRRGLKRLVESYAEEEFGQRGPPIEDGKT